jgi:acetyltransferase-like isoleucine patch superfamily enzyme
MKRYLKGLWMLLLLWVGHLPSHTLRRVCYYFLGFQFPYNSVIYSGLEIRKPQLVKISANSIIGHNCILDGRMGITIGQNVNLSSGVWIWTLQHDPQSGTFETKGGNVIIEDYAWVSCRSVILPGVKIAKGTVVAAGSIVTKDTEAYSIVGGIPAKKIGERNRDLKYQLGNERIPFI